MVHQLSSFLDSKFSPLLSGFRKKYSCHVVLLSFTEKCTVAVDSKNHIRGYFNSLGIWLHVYGADVSARMLIANYLSHREQRVKIGSNKNKWLRISRGAPKESVLGPFILTVSKMIQCTVFLKCLFYFNRGKYVGVLAESVAIVLSVLLHVTAGYLGMLITLRKLSRINSNWWLASSITIITLVVLL